MTTLNDLDAIGGGSAKLWVSGETVTKWDYRKSPLDGEVYQRTATTGTGTTDPADDITNYVAKSFQRASSIIGVNLNGASNGVSSNTIRFNSSVKTSISGITAGTRTKILDLSGRGSVDFLGVFKHSADNGTIEIIVDGRTILNETTINANDTVSHIILGGSGSDGNLGFPQHIAVPYANLVQFRRNFVVWYTPVTTGTGTDGVLGYVARATR